MSPQKKPIKRILLYLGLIVLYQFTIQTYLFGATIELERKEFVVNTHTGMRLMVAARIPITNRLGKAVLLVHGSGVGWIYWDIPLRAYSIMDYLARKGIDVYAVECRGYGKSTKPHGMEVNATTIANDLKSVIQEILLKSGVSQIGMVGHSSGGTILLLAAGFYPEWIDRMILIGTPYKKIHPRFVEYANKVIAMGKEPGKDYVPNLHYKDIEKRLDNHESDVVVWYKKVVEEHYGLMPAGVYPDVIKNPAVNIVPNIKIPTLILNGSNEYVVDPEDALILFKELGTSDKGIIILPGGYHLMFLEKRGAMRLQETLFFWLTKK